MVIVDLVFFASELDQRWRASQVCFVCCGSCGSCGDREKGRRRGSFWKSAEQKPPLGTLHIELTNYELEMLQKKMFEHHHCDSAASTALRIGKCFHLG